MATRKQRAWLMVLLVFTAVIAGCGEKWATTQFPEAGFSATLPLPVMSEPLDRGILRYWTQAGNVQIQILRIPVPEGVGTSADVILTDLYDDIKKREATAHEVSPSKRSQLQGRYETLEFLLSGKTPKGSDADSKGLAVLVENRVFFSTVIWHSGDENGPLHANRFLESFKIL